MRAGYSATPLARKLGFKDGMRLFWEGVPQSVADEVRAGLAEHHVAVSVLAEPEGPIDAAHVFVTSRGVMEAWLGRLMPMLAPGGFIWISWPKKASKVTTDVTEDVIRELCLPMGLVDVKVCAVDAVWSGLKLMRRRA